MDVKYYCDTMQYELTYLKAKIYDIIRHADKISASKKKKLEPRFSELYDLVDYLSQKIDYLKKECPAEFSSITEDIEKKKKELIEKMGWWDIAL